MINGAEATNIENEFGRATECLRAGLVGFGMLSKIIVAAARYVPVVSIIIHCTPANNNTVSVNGISRKDNGNLLRASVDKTSR